MSHNHGVAAFQYAHKVLEWCQREGLVAQVEMSWDGSGALHLYGQAPTEEQANFLEQVLHSERWHETKTGSCLRSCCGWHDGWEEWALRDRLVGLCEHFDPIRGTCLKLGRRTHTEWRCHEHAGSVDRVRICEPTSAS